MPMDALKGLQQISPDILGQFYHVCLMLGVVLAGIRVDLHTAL